MPEYKIIQGTCKECQKKLNQWQHDYILKIFGVAMNGSDIVIVLYRVELEKSRTWQSDA
ncbi:hypothetical protein KAR91_22075 [Candidatus Pacearchaeota archaeon]|nr:hypothetical protein [Candidatus Pacearchaeota archaeon]